MIIWAINSRVLWVADSPGIDSLLPAIPRKIYPRAWSRVFSVLWGFRSATWEPQISALCCPGVYIGGMLHRKDSFLKHKGLRWSGVNVCVWGWSRDRMDLRPHPLISKQRSNGRWNFYVRIAVLSSLHTGHNMTNLNHMQNYIGVDVSSKTLDIYCPLHNKYWKVKNDEKAIRSWIHWQSLKLSAQETPTRLGLMI